MTKPKATKAAETPPSAPPAPAAPLPTAREAMLELLWMRQAQALLKAMDDGTPSAATLSVAGKFLGDNDTTHATLKQWQRSGLLGDIDAKDLPFAGGELDGEDQSSTTAQVHSGPIDLKGATLPFSDDETEG